MKGQTGPSQRGIGRSAVVVGGILFSVGAGFLYQKLTALQVGKGAFTYSLSYTIPVVVCAAAAYLIVALRLIRFFGNRNNTIEEEVLEAEETVEYLPEEVSDEEKYPWSEDSEPLPEETAAQQRAEKIASVLAAQRAAEIDLPVPEKDLSEESDEWDALYKAPDSMEENAAIREMYADLPTELPPGYTLPQELSEEEEESLEEIEEQEPRVRSPLWELLPAICAVVAFAAVLVFASSFWTKAGEDGIWVTRMGRVQQYSWDQVESYTVDAGFSGGELVLEFQMEDGRQVKIVPASYAQTDMFADQYENLYQYWLHADNILTAQGTDKTVSRVEYLADTYQTREDGSWQYVRQIIGYEEEPPIFLQ